MRDVHINREELSPDVNAARESINRKICLDKIKGRSEYINELHTTLLKISSCNASVLISGETGTGKELIAQAIHYLSPRAGKPFIPINCGAIPEALFENEFFGHVKGAFTDAKTDRMGLVQRADRGTLLLDEVGQMSQYSQVKLLRLLQDREFKPLGDSRILKSDIRIIAATNVELMRLVSEGTFREDLYYRLNIVSIHIPPLRERKEDIPVLAEHFLKKYAIEYNRPVKNITDRAMRSLITYPWPGNVRELENKIAGMVVMSNSTEIKEGDVRLPVEGSSSRNTSQLEHFNIAKKKAVEEFEKTYLVKLLTDQMGDVVRSAKKAGKSRTALWNLLRKHHIRPQKFSCQ